MNLQRFVGVSATIALLALSSTGCGDAGSELTLVSSRDIVVPDDKPVRNYDQFMTDSIASIEAFWAEQYPLVYGDE